MEVNDALVDKIARLARLRYREDEREGIRNDLQRMIHFADKLNELDTTGVAPLLHVTNNVNILRPDAVQGSIDRAAGLKNAPLHNGEFFQVPKVIKK
jgi:aspartyl-tRNA(Asn)/glutamyl-tRNA(Gln) amidotransferase subunit C